MAYDATMMDSKGPLDYARQTVLITGASAGIGAEFARQLAGRGSDLVLVARRADRLDTLAVELQDKHGVAVTTLPMDLMQSGVGERLRNELGARSIEVTGVVNNAGFANLGLFHEIALPAFMEEIAVDVSSVVEISHAFMPELRQRGDGFLLNVASMAAYQGNPTMAVYGACKAFVLSLTEALWYEARGTGLRVLAVSPGATQTEFFEVAGEAADGGAPRTSSSAVVTRSLAALSRSSPPPSVVVGWLDRFSLTAARLVSRRRLITILGGIMQRAAARQ
jgi:uncharacterized protein